MNFGLLSGLSVGREIWLADTGCDRLEIEIGPGSCGYLVEAARRSPATLFVGIEIYRTAVELVRSRHELPANVRLVEGDGGWMVSHLLAPASVDAVHVYFPDPWWKKRHHKRRLFQPGFCEAVARTLVPGGAVYVVTDVAPVFREIVENMEAAGFHAEPWVRDAADPACSSYERKYRQQNRTFEQAIFKKKSGTGTN
jgi:tRNA (guanine-N7-)-methyltransferase